MICPSATMRAIATIAVAFGRLVTNFSLSANGPGYSCHVEQQAGGSGGLRYFGRDKLRAKLLYNKNQKYFQPSHEV